MRDPSPQIRQNFGASVPAAWRPAELSRLGSGASRVPRERARSGSPHVLYPGHCPRDQPRFP